MKMGHHHRIREGKKPSGECAAAAALMIISSLLLYYIIKNRPRIRSDNIGTIFQIDLKLYI